MSIWTVLFLLAFVAMIAMHLRGGGHGGHAGCGGGHGHDHDDHRQDDHVHRPAESPPDVRAPENQPVGAAEPHSGHGAHRHA